MIEILPKKKFDKKPIQLLIYLPNKVLTNNERLVYGTVYNWLCQRQDVFMVDSEHWLNEAIVEKRQNIYAILREPCAIQPILDLTKIVYPGDNNLNLEYANYAAVARFDDGISRRWIEDENYIRFPVDQNNIGIPDGILSTLKHHIKYDLKTYNIYISGFETCKIKKLS